MRYARISDQTIRRLPKYLRALLFASGQGQDEISSKDLAEQIGVHSWQVRKDFSFFGEFGTPGVGYNVLALVKEIKKILRLGEVRKAALIGVGNLGSAVLAFPGFSQYNLQIAAAFDINPSKVGQRIMDVKVENIRKVSDLAHRGIQLAILTVPGGDVAQGIVDQLVEVGVKGILNFSACHLVVPAKVRVTNIDIAIDLASLPYYMR